MPSNRHFRGKKRVPIGQENPPSGTLFPNSAAQQENTTAGRLPRHNSKRAQKVIETNSHVASSQPPVLFDKDNVSTWRQKDFLHLVKAFVGDGKSHHLSFPSSLSSAQRMYIHRIASSFNLTHKSHGDSTNRVLKLSKQGKKIFSEEDDGIAVEGMRIKKTEGFQGAQALDCLLDDDNLTTLSNLLKKYWNQMNQSLRVEPNRLEKPRKQMRASQPGLDTTPLGKKNSSRYQSLLKQRQTLPAFMRREDIVNTLIENDVMIISGATGCGKTTQVPQIIYDAQIFPSDSIILCTQPRRISAISVACRVAEERGEVCGASCGYVIRFENKTSRSTRIIYETTGILLRHLHTEPDLNGVSCVIVDEVHERDLETDFCLLLLKDRLVAQRKYPDRYRFKLKLVVMSATVQIDSLVNYFTGTNRNGHVPLITIQGTLFPVEEKFLEDAIKWVGVPATSVPAMALLHNRPSPEINKQDGEDAKEDLYDKLRSSVFDAVERDAETLVPYELISKLITYIHGKERNRAGSILVFLPGWAAIMRVYNMLQLSPSYRELYVLMLHSSLTSSEQQRVFFPAPKRYRKVVLATSIAETSITIDDVVYVIDSCLVKRTLYDPCSNISSLKATLIAKANGKQRRGRAGRCQAGVCIHLLPVTIYDGLPDFLLPEMLRSPLEEVCLQLKAIHHEENCECVLMRAMDTPPAESVRNAVKFLKEIGALTDEDEQLTNLGHALAQLPVHPLLGKMLFAGACFGVLDSVATIAAGLSVKSLFVKPSSSEKAAARENLLMIDENNLSDHLCVRKVYREWLRSGRSSNYAVEHFMDPSALHTLDHTKHQLLHLVLRSPLLRRLKKPVEDASCHDENTGLIRLVVLWSLYPRIASIEYRAKRGSRIPNVICWDDKQAAFSVNSVLASAKRGDIATRTFVMYYERMQLEAKLTLFDSSCVSPLDVALCVKQLTMYPLSQVPKSILLDTESEMSPASRFNLDTIDNKQDYIAMFFDAGKKLFVTTKRMAQTVKMARSCMDYYLALSIKKLRADVFPQELLRAIAMLIGYPLLDLAGKKNRSVEAKMRSTPVVTSTIPKGMPSFIRGYSDADSLDSDAEDDMVVVESEEDLDEPVALTTDQKKYVTAAFGNLALLRDSEVLNFPNSEQNDYPANAATPACEIGQDARSLKAKDFSKVQNDHENNDDSKNGDEDEDVIIARPGQLVLV